MNTGGKSDHASAASGSWCKAIFAEALTLVCLGFVGTPLSAQLGDPEEDPDNCADLAVNGYWTGFWDLGPQINDQPTEEPPLWLEITHAAVLAPPNDRYVLLWAERAVDCGDPDFDEPYETWMFNWLHPNRPIRKIVVPQPSNEIGRTDLFCGGHSFGEDGQLISYGGTDYVEQCLTNDFRLGNDRVWTFDNVALTSTTQPAWHDGGPASPMEDIRWYPSAVELGNGDQLVLGDFECSTCSHQASITRQRGRTVNTATWEFGWDPTTHNYFNSIKGNIGPAFCDELPGNYIWHRGYPQIHVLPGRYLFAHAANFFTGPSNPLPNVGSVLLDFGFCEAAPTLETERWIGTGQSALQPLEFRGRTVLIVDDQQDPVGQSTCVVYAIGGDDAPGHGGCPCQDGISDQVLRMENPSADAVWEDDVPQLKRSRTYANAVLMLDGSIIVFGGLRKVMDSSGNWTGNCDYVLRPERLEPDEVFETPLAEWTLLCKGFRRHAHHSVAGALPNGQAFLGGGDDAPDEVPDPADPDCDVDPEGPDCDKLPCNVPAPTNLGSHVIELFSPPYMFQGPAPEIVAVSQTAPFQGDTITVDVEIPGPLNGEYKVALLAPSTMTHSVNFSQRYVMLNVTGEIELSPELWRLQVRIPSLPEAVPPGYYMLTVVSSTGVPSAANWIKVRAP